MILSMTDIPKGRRLFYDKMSFLALLLLLLLLTYIVYSRLAGHEFVSVDDSLYVFNNPRVCSGLSLENVIWAFKTMTAEFWHPLTWLSYMLDTELYGVSPGGYLLTNLMLHLFNSALIFTCFRRLTGGIWESWVMAVIFALHPIHVEPVAWVSGRKELLYACFWLLTLLAYDAYCRSPGWIRYLAMLIFFLLGMMSKPMIVTLPFVLLLLDYWPLNRDGAPDPGGTAGMSRLRRWRYLVIEKIPLFFICLGGIAIALIAQERGGGLVSTETIPLSSRIAHALAAYAVYLKKALWPGDLTVFYPVPVIGHGVLAAAAILLAALTVIALLQTRRQRYLFTGWFWFLGTLVPVIGIVKVGDFFIADRYMYIPLTGILIIVVFSLKALMAKLSHRLIWMIVIPALFIAVYAPATYFQVETWRDSETLYRHALAVTDKNFLAHNALGHLQAARNDKAGAIAHFLKAAEIRPDLAPLWVSLGKALAFDHRWPEAEDAFNRAAELAPEHPAVWFYLGCTRAARGDMAGALKFLLQSLEKTSKDDQRVDSLHAKVMDFYQRGLYYESNNSDNRSAASVNRYYKMALKLLKLNVSQKHLTRLVVEGYDLWLTGLSTNNKRGVD